MREIQAPAPYVPQPNERSIFLAGSIEMGAAEDWQKRVAKMLHAQPLAVLNPRRDDWDSSWRQSIDDPQFCEQVEWELLQLECADAILMYFAPDTKSPITLLELGLHIHSGKLVVCSPQGFWRRGNIEIVCRWHGVMLFEELNNAVTHAVKLASRTHRA